MQPGLDTEKLLNSDRQDNPDYLGYITFKQPEKLYSYTVEEGQQELTSEEVEEGIVLISQYRGQSASAE